MINLVLTIALQSAVVFFIFPWINPDFRIKGSLSTALIVVMLFIVLNWILRFLVVIFTLGIGWILYYLSLGLLGLVANAVVLILIGRLFPNEISVPGFGAAFWGGLCLSIASFLMKR